MGFNLMMKMKQLLRRAETRPTPVKRRDGRVSRMMGFNLMMKMKLLLRRAEARPTSVRRRDGRVSRIDGIQPHDEAVVAAG
ncbi:hypothetical protein [Cardiobacterium valvarum]|uniref:hypothetical protein n=1 Tax=Cardiobacterium valvarum TaxID=194702 RepID=UPI000E204B4F|nr:hypothetical protein [Cardiobacterium valvarum]